MTGPRPTTVFLVRHGLPTSGEHIDPPLSETGQAQAALLGAWLVHEQPVAVYASDYRRAWQTAAPLARLLGLEVQQRKGLREWASSRTHYVRPEDLAHTPEGRAFAEGRFEDFVPDHDRVALRATMVGELRGIGDRHPGQTVAVVSHGGALNTLLASAVGSERPFFFNPGYAAVSRMQVWPDGRLVVASVNETAHLAPERLRAFLTNDKAATE